MKTQNINTSASFCSLRRGQNMPRTLYNSIKDAPVIKSFGEKYNGTISCEPFLSSRNPNKIKLALRVSDLEPISFFEKLKNRFKSPIEKPATMRLKTRAVTEDEFVSLIAKERADTLFKIYNK